MRIVSNNLNIIQYYQVRSKKTMTSDTTKEKKSRAKVTPGKGKKYKVYAIDKYAGKTNTFIENDYQECTLDKLSEKLENEENGYHMRLYADQSYVFFGDCDNFNGTFDKFVNSLVNFLDIKYDIKLSNIWESGQGHISRSHESNQNR